MAINDYFPKAANSLVPFRLESVSISAQATMFSAQLIMCDKVSLGLFLCKIKIASDCQQAIIFSRIYVR